MQCPPLADFGCFRPVQRCACAVGIDAARSERHQGVGCALVAATSTCNCTSARHYIGTPWLSWQCACIDVLSLPAPWGTCCSCLLQMHVDSGGYAQHGHRIHVPIVSHANMRFTLCPGREPTDIGIAAAAAAAAAPRSQQVLDAPLPPEAPPPACVDIPVPEGLVFELNNRVQHKASVCECMHVMYVSTYASCCYGFHTSSCSLSMHTTFHTSS